MNEPRPLVEAQTALRVYDAISDMVREMVREEVERALPASQKLLAKPPEKEWLFLREAALVARVRDADILAAIRRGDLPAAHMARTRGWRIARADLNEWIRSHQDGSEDRNRGTGEDPGDETLVAGGNPAATAAADD